METMNMKAKKSAFGTREITKMALLAALLCVSAYITIPLGFTPASLTLQTMIVNLIAILLTPMESFITLLVYILIGAVGVPIFSGGQGGLGKLFGPTGGYIFAFLAAAPAMSFTKKYFIAAAEKVVKNTSVARIAACTVNAILVGMVIVYLIGTVYMKFTLNRGWMDVLLMAVIPFIPLDIAKCILASVIGVPLKKALDKLN